MLEKRDITNHDVKSIQIVILLANKSASLAQWWLTVLKTEVHTRSIYRSSPSAENDLLMS